MNFKVLILTRSKFFAEALKFILHSVASFIDVATSVEELTSRLRHEEYDVILCDLSCANLDLGGIDKKKARLIVFSFDPPDRHREMIMKIGADGYINRPLNPEAVIEAIRLNKD